MRYESALCGMNHALKEVVRENVPFFVVAIVVVGFMVALLADFSGRASACKYEKNETQQYFCYLNTSVSEHDVRICNKIFASDERNGCFVYYAIQTRDFTPCDFILKSDSKDFCYSHVAFAKRDSELCSGVQFMPRRDGCYERLAISERNETVCMTVSSESGRASCVSYVENAIITRTTKIGSIS